MKKTLYLAPLFLGALYAMPTIAADVELGPRHITSLTVWKMVL